MREKVHANNGNLKPVLDAQMSKMSPEQRVAMASLNEEAKKREAEKRKWDAQEVARKAKAAPMKEIEVDPEDVRQATPEELQDLKDLDDIGHDRAVAEALEEKCLPDPLGPKVDVPQVTNYLRYTQATLADEFHRVFDEEIMALRNAGPEEYAHDDSSPFANFERGANDMGIDR